MIANIPYLKGLGQSLNKDNARRRPMAPGYVDLNFDGMGPLGNPMALSGEGFIHLKDAVISPTQKIDTYDPFMIGTFEIREAVSAFSLQQGYLRIDGGRLAPTSRIMATGTYHLITEQLNFRLQIYPFAEVPFAFDCILCLTSFQ